MVQCGALLLVGDTMITTGGIQEFQSGIFRLFLEPCSALVLQYVLSEDVPYVWVENHLPNERFEWWNVQLPLRKGGSYHTLEVRLLNLDLQFTTQNFLQLLPEFQEAGMMLFQMTKPWPASLTPRYLPAEARYKILVQNGLYLEFDLHHAGEYARIVSPHREVLERIQRHPVIASGDLP